MKYQSILIVTYGRSGSTLLQGVVNSIDGSLIRGENFNFIFPIFNSYKALENAINDESPLDAKYGTPTHPCFGASKLDKQLFISTQKKLIKDLLIADDDIKKIKYYGFKEIRYFEPWVMKDLEEYLDFLQLVFENVAIIFNTRDSISVTKSAWWKEVDKACLIKSLEEANTKFHAYAEKNDNCIIVDYEKILDKSDVRRLFDFLGEHYDDTKINRVLDIEHSYDNHSVSFNK